MRILFCDDDEAFVRQLHGQVAGYFAEAGLDPPESAFFQNGDELIRALEAGETGDIAFLDVEMPGQSGIIAGEKLMAKNPRAKVMMVTAYPDYLDDAMRFHVFRYLLKPVDRERLFRNLRDALYQYSIETHPVPVETAGGVEILPADEIVCVERMGRKTWIYTVGRVLETSGSIDSWRQALDLPSFYPCYRSFIVNFRYVSAFTRDTVTLRYNGQEKIAYLARRKYRDFRNAYLLYLESMK